MNVIENVTIVGRTIGENDLYVLMNENTGKTFSLLNVRGLDLELGLEGTVMIEEMPVKHIVSFEPALVEELV
jgi:hypothetical protein